jgi:sulfur carrier protein
MKVIINDNLIDLDDSAANLEKAISQSGVEDFRGLAIAVNSSVVPKTNWASFQLKENDTIIIIHATQGG